MSVISGVIQISIIGGFIQTPYVSILVGAFAGIVTGILSHFVQNKINSTQIRDSKGIIVIYLINCILCSYFICPIIIKAYKNLNANLDYNEGFHMIYTAISLGIGFGFGLLAGAFRSCIKEENGLSDMEFFNKAYMLHRIPKKPILVVEAPTQEKLTLNTVNNSVTKPISKLREESLIISL